MKVRPIRGANRVVVPPIPRLPPPIWVDEAAAVCVLSSSKPFNSTRTRFRGFAVLAFCCAAESCLFDSVLFVSCAGGAGCCADTAAPATKSSSPDNVVALRQHPHEGQHPAESFQHRPQSLHTTASPRQTRAPELYPTRERSCMNPSLQRR